MQGRPTWCSLCWATVRGLVRTREQVGVVRRYKWGCALIKAPLYWEDLQWVWSCVCLPTVSEMMEVVWVLAERLRKWSSYHGMITLTTICYTSLFPTNLFSICLQRQMSKRYIHLSQNVTCLASEGIEDGEKCLKMTWTTEKRERWLPYPLRHAAKNFGHRYPL